jgi:hypothetical protein
MSFVDLMGSDRWSEADIKTRLHALIRTQFSQEAEDELSRASLGAALQQHTLTPEEYQRILQFKALTEHVAVVAAQARQDAALLNETLDAEIHLRRLAQPQVTLTVEGPYVPQTPYVDDPLLTPEENEAASLKYVESYPTEEEYMMTQTPEALAQNRLLYEKDLEERAQAQAALDAARPAVRELLAIRNPVS